MTKVVILGDVHFSVKNGNEAMLQHQLDFFHNTLIPFCKLNDIRDIWQTGDLFDNRKHTNNKVANEVERLFDWIDTIEQIDFRCILGNHDVFYKNTNIINTPYTILKHNIRVIDSFDYIDNTDFVPWINKENETEFLTKVANSNSRFCFGHFEFAGFEMSKGQIMKHGLDPSLFSRYELVISGHYHSSSRKGNVLYVGTPMQYTWADYGEKKGFWVFDTETGKTLFVENKKELFVKIDYNEDNLPEEVDIKNKWVRLYVNKKTDQEKYESFLAKLESMKPEELKVIENLVDRNENYVIENVDATNAVSIMKEYVAQTKFNNLQPEKVNDLLEELYKEALLQ